MARIKSFQRHRMDIYPQTVNGVCAGSTPVNNVAFAGFSVEVQCTSTTHTEGVSPASTIVTLALDCHRYQRNLWLVCLFEIASVRHRFAGSALKVAMALEPPVKDVVLRVFGGRMNSKFPIYFNQFQFEIKVLFEQLKFRHYTHWINPWVLRNVIER